MKKKKIFLQKTEDLQITGSSSIWLFCSWMKRLLAVDFDGTLIGASRRIAPTVMEQLDRVGKMGVVRVLATGRNIDSLLSMMPADTPLDYLVTGSGTLTLRWPSRSVFQQNCIPSALCHGIAEMLRSQGISFFLLEAPPQCEYCYGFRGEGPTCCEFDRRLRGYKSKTRSYDDLCCGAASRWQALSSDFSQFIIFSDSVEMYRTLSHNIRQVEKAMMKEGTAAKALRIVRTTSPFDHKSMWVEVLLSQRRRPLKQSPESTVSRGSSVLG